MTLSRSSLVLIWRILCAVALFPAQSLAAGPDWQTYENHEHGFTVDYPMGLFNRMSSAEGGDGTTFTNTSGDVSLSLYGFNNGDELPMRTVRDIIVENYADRDITYERLRKGWFVLSGYETINGVPSIFYHRLAKNRDGNRYSVMEFTYPVGDREMIDPLLKRMSRSLTSPRDE